METGGAARIIPGRQSARVSHGGDGDAPTHTRWDDQRWTLHTMVLMEEIVAGMEFQRVDAVASAANDVIESHLLAGDPVLDFRWGKAGWRPNAGYMAHVDRDWIPFLRDARRFVNAAGFVPIQFMADGRFLYPTMPALGTFAVHIFRHETLDQIKLRYYSNSLGDYDDKYTMIYVETMPRIDGALNARVTPLLKMFNWIADLRVHALDAEATRAHPVLIVQDAARSRTDARGGSSTTGPKREQRTQERASRWRDRTENLLQKKEIRVEDWRDLTDAAARMQDHLNGNFGSSAIDKNVHARSSKVAAEMTSKMFLLPREKAVAPLHMPQVRTDLTQLNEQYCEEVSRGMGVPFSLLCGGKTAGRATNTASATDRAVFNSSVGQFARIVERISLMAYNAMHRQIDEEEIRKEILSGRRELLTPEDFNRARLSMADKSALVTATDDGDAMPRELAAKFDPRHVSAINANTPGIGVSELLRLANTTALSQMMAPRRGGRQRFPDRPAFLERVEAIRSAQSENTMKITCNYRILANPDEILSIADRGIVDARRAADLALVSLGLPASMMHPKLRDGGVKDGTSLARFTASQQPRTMQPQAGGAAAAAAAAMDVDGAAAAMDVDGAGSSSASADAKKGTADVDVGTMRKAVEKADKEAQKDGDKKASDTERVEIDIPAHKRTIMRKRRAESESGTAGETGKKKAAERAAKRRKKEKANA